MRLEGKPLTTISSEQDIGYGVTRYDCDSSYAAVARKVIVVTVPHRNDEVLGLQLVTSDMSAGPWWLKEKKVPNDSGNPASEADDMPWQHYEELVKDIYQALGRASGVVIECWGNACRVEAPTGVFHQIDVLTSHTDGLHQYRTAIECKNWNKKVGLPIVRDFAQIVDDARLSKGIVVSKMGFTGPAKTYAESKRIGLVELRRPLDRDWDGYIRKIYIALTIDQTQVYDIHFDLTAPNPGPGEETIQDGPIHWNLQLNQILIGIPGKEAETLQNLSDKERGKCLGEEEYDLRLPAGCVVTIPEFPEHPAHGYSITGVSFKVRYNPPITKEIVVPADDHVYMVMESIFDGRRFTVTKDGKISENTA